MTLLLVILFGVGIWRAGFLGALVASVALWFLLQGVGVRVRPVVIEMPVAAPSLAVPAPLAPAPSPSSSLGVPTV